PPPLSTTKPATPIIVAPASSGQALTPDALTLGARARIAEEPTALAMPVERTAAASPVAIQGTAAPGLAGAAAQTPGRPAVASDLPTLHAPRTQGAPAAALP